MDAAMTVATTAPTPASTPASTPWATPQESTEDLLRYIWTRDLPMTLALIDAGADLNLADREGRTPLHAAVQSAMPDVVGRLLDRWADVNRTNDAGRTALDLSIYWALRNPIHGSNATAIIRRIIQGGGLSGQEVGEIAATAAAEARQPQSNSISDDYRVWVTQCKEVAKSAKGWEVAPPGATNEVHVPRPTGTDQSGKGKGDRGNDQCTTAALPSIADAPPNSDGQSDGAEDELTRMIQQLTATWDESEIWSFRIPASLEGVTDLSDEHDLRMRLFFGFNHTTIFRHGITGALGLPSEGETALDIELLTTRAMAKVWGAKNGVPPTDLIRPVPPGARTCEIRAAFRVWFEAHTPEDVLEWTNRHCPGTLTAETIPYDLTTFKYSPLPNQTAVVTPKVGTSETRTEEATGSTPGAASSTGPADGQARETQWVQQHPSKQSTGRGPWDGIHAVWTKDRDTTWDDLQPAPTTQHRSAQDSRTWGWNADYVPDWTTAPRTDSGGPIPAVTLFRPRDKMAIRCENKCDKCEDRCFQARNFRYGGHVGRCLCPKHTSMALAETAKKYICKDTEPAHMWRGEDRDDGRHQPYTHAWSDWSTRGWTSKHDQGRGWQSSNWNSSTWGATTGREGTRQPTDPEQPTPGRVTSKADGCAGHDVTHPNPERRRRRNRRHESRGGRNESSDGHRGTNCAAAHATAARHTTCD